MYDIIRLAFLGLPLTVFTVFLECLHEHIKRSNRWVVHELKTIMGLLVQNPGFKTLCHHCSFEFQLIIFLEEL